MTIQLKSGAGYFSINGTQYPVGNYRVVIHGDNIGVTEVGSSGYINAVNPEFYGNWDDETGTPYATKQELLDDLHTALFSSATVIGPDVVITNSLTIPDDGLITATNDPGKILVNNGTNYFPVLMSGDATMASDGTITVNAGAADAVVMSSKVLEAGGILKGQAVYINGATGGLPNVSLADNSDFSKGDVLAIATETKTNAQTILVTTLGLLENIDTSAFGEGDILYLGLGGALTNIHPSGVNAVQRVGHVIKSNAATGSMIVELDALTIINDHNGILRHQIVNQNAGNAASSAYTLVNDLGHRSSISMVGSNYSLIAGIEEAMILYNEGYNHTLHVTDGNFGHEWWTDETDSHNLSATAKMWLSATGVLKTIQQCIIHSAAQADDHAIEFHVQANGFGDVKAIDVDYVTGAIGAGEDEGVILVNIDESLAAGGEIFALEVLTTTLGTDKVIAVKTGVGIDAISQDSGVFVDIATILNKAVDVTAALADGGAGNITMFVADNDTITIGGSTKFAELEVLLATGASQNIQPTWEYSTGVGTWAFFTPTDGSNGFQNTGAMLWDSDDLAGWIVGTGSEYLVRITRTRNGLSTAPIVDEIQFADPDIFEWDKNGDVHVNSLKATGTPAYNDDAAAGVGGLLVGQIYQTTGAGAAPLNAAGILMIKQ